MSYLIGEEHDMKFPFTYRYGVIREFCSESIVMTEIEHEALGYQYQRNVMVLFSGKLQIWNYQEYYCDNLFVAMEMTVRRK